MLRLAEARDVRQDRGRWPHCHRAPFRGGMAIVMNGFSWEILGEELDGARRGHLEEVVLGRLVARPHAGLRDPGGHFAAQIFAGIREDGELHADAQIAAGVVEFLDADGEVVPLQLPLRDGGARLLGALLIGSDLEPAELVELAADRRADERRDLGVRSTGLVRDGGDRDVVLRVRDDPRGRRRSRRAERPDLRARPSAFAIWRFTASLLSTPSRSFRQPTAAGFARRVSATAAAWRTTSLESPSALQSGPTTASSPVCPSARAAFVRTRKSSAWRRPTRKSVSESARASGRRDEEERDDDGDGERGDSRSRRAGARAPRVRSHPIVHAITTVGRFTRPQTSLVRDRGGRALWVCCARANPMCARGVGLALAGLALALVALLTARTPPREPMAYMSASAASPGSKRKGFAATAVICWFAACSPTTPARRSRTTR